MWPVFAWTSQGPIQSPKLFSLDHHHKRGLLFIFETHSGKKKFAKETRMKRVTQQHMAEGQWVLVTGGLGYIGSHVCVELALRGYNLIVVDRLEQHRQVDKIRTILKKHECSSELHVTYKNLEKDELLIPRECDYIIHLAALKSVSESVSNPLRYYENNLKALFAVIECAKWWRNTRPVFIFSSSACVYGVPPSPAGIVNEETPLCPVNPYGHSKVMCEQILKDVVKSPESPLKCAVLLRYFNPVGAHPSGLIGEDASLQAANLMPKLLQTAAGQRDAFHVFGTDYSTPDGTAIRDYIHVMDLAEAHVAACRTDIESGTAEVINVGRGEGVSVRQMLGAMQIVVGRSIPTIESDRRPGDAPSCFTGCDKAEQVLKWKATRGVTEMCHSAAKAAGINTVVQ
jgi:UDP-glucose 4-epimerase